MMKASKRIRAAATLAWLGLALANHARAVDVRDWGRKYDNASERFVVLDSSIKSKDKSAPYLCVGGMGVARP